MQPTENLKVTLPTFADAVSIAVVMDDHDHPAGIFNHWVIWNIPASYARIPGVSIAIVENGELAWAGAYSYADLSAERPMTTDAACRAESISKSVTARGVMRLIEEGRMAELIPTGYEPDGTPVPPYVYPEDGSGGFFADTEDLARFVIATMDSSTIPS